ncbi:hypothetical protein FQA47_011936 [Scomber scombrus]|uniref:Uncharacterized protein n=1 Tax=Scomber scombrus TaxID=13677 RepID=A0AAV1NHS3_SCOSC
MIFADPSDDRIIVGFIDGLMNRKLKEKASHVIDSCRRVRFGGAAVGQLLLFRLALISTVLLGSEQMRIYSISFERVVAYFWISRRGAVTRGCSTFDGKQEVGRLLTLKCHNMEKAVFSIS